MLSAAKPVLHAARPMVTVAPPPTPLYYTTTPQLLDVEKILSERCCASIDDATPNGNRCAELLSPQHKSYDIGCNAIPKQG